MKLATLCWMPLLFVACTSAPQTGFVNREPQSATDSKLAAAKLGAVWESRFADTSLREAFRNEIRDELSRRVRTLTRSVSFYHYGGRGAEGLDASRGDKPAEAYTTPLELRPPEAIAYFREYSSLFRAGPLESQVGPGIYAAIDPIQSESYAKAPWFLLEIRATAGMKYLDLRPWDNLEVSKEFVEKWFAEGSPTSQSSAYSRVGNRFVVSFRSLLEIKSLREQISVVLSELGVDALAYAWSRPALSICSKIGMKQPIAFNFINPAYLDKTNRYRVYVQNLEGNPSEERSAAYSRILDSIQAAPLQFMGTTEGTYSYTSNGKTTTTTQPAIQPNWALGLFRMRILIQPWTVALSRPYLPDAVLKTEGDGAKLYAATIAAAPNTYSSVNFALNTDVMKKTDYPTNSNSSSSSSTSSVSQLYVYDPLAILKKTNPKNYARIIAETQSSTFGCSEKYPKENETPDF
jgi:hypothetical protein